MTNERIVYMPEFGEGGPTNSERNFTIQRTEQDAAARSEATEVRHLAARKVHEQGRRRGERPQTNRARAGGYIPAPEQPDREAAAVSDTQDQEQLPSQQKEQQEKSPEEKFNELVAAGDADGARALMRESLFGDDPEVQKKLKPVDALIDEATKPKEEQNRKNIVSALQDAGGDADTKAVMDRLLREGRSPDEIKALYEEAGLPYESVIDESEEEAAEEGDGRPEGSPTEDEQEAQAGIMALDDALSKGDKEGGNKILEALKISMKKAIGVALKIVIYAAIAMYLYHIATQAALNKMATKR